MEAPRRIGDDASLGVGLGVGAARNSEAIASTIELTSLSGSLDNSPRLPALAIRLVGTAATGLIDGVVDGAGEGVGAGAGAGVGAGVGAGTSFLLPHMPHDMAESGFSTVHLRHFHLVYSGKE